MTHPKTDAVAALADQRFEETLTQLGEYLAFPAISCDAAHAGDVRALATRNPPSHGTPGLQLEGLTNISRLVGDALRSRDEKMERLRFAT